MLCYEASKFNNFNEPVLIALKLVNNLTGCNGYDCYFESNKELMLLLEDNEKILRKKIMKHSLSGARGSGSLEDHKKLGGNVEVDISCQYLKFFEEDEDKLNGFVEKFAKGELSCGEVKQILFEKLNEMFNKIRNNKEKNINKDLIESFRFEKEKN
jgi:tryptophanyl-tRNA synthetase